jgi:hypothetical protein
LGGYKRINWMTQISNFFGGFLDKLGGREDE